METLLADPDTRALWRYFTELSRIPRGSKAEAAASASGMPGDMLRTGLRASNEPQDVFAIEAETVQTLVTHDPARTAQVIRGWIAGDRGNLK